MNQNKRFHILLNEAFIYFLIYVIIYRYLQEYDLF